jgi:hypothetical protein
MPAAFFSQGDQIIFSKNLITFGKQITCSMPPNTFDFKHRIRPFYWVLFGAVIFDMVNTLAGQPESFWRHPETAIRFDGLSINNLTNHFFVFFLGQGWPVYLFTCITYLIALFLLVHRLPWRISIITMLSVIFAHYYQASNWLAIRWHMGMQGPFFYGLVISSAIAILTFPSMRSSKAIQRLRWIMVFAMLTDAVVTLWGQPSGYWLHPAIVDEGNEVSRFFLTRGWYAYLFEQALICIGVFWLISVLPTTWGFITALSFTFAGFTGASNWFFYRWILGLEAPIIFGMVLSSAIVLLSLCLAKKGEEKNASLTAEESVLKDNNKKAWTWC